MTKQLSYLAKLAIHYLNKMRPYSSVASLTQAPSAVNESPILKMNSAPYQPRLLIICGGVPFNSPFIPNPKELQSSKGKNRFQGLSWYIETTLPIASLKFISPYSYPKEHPRHRRKQIDFRSRKGTVSTNKNVNLSLQNKI